jgi:hypothetical protein
MYDFSAEGQGKSPQLVPETNLLPTQAPFGLYVTFVTALLG